MPDPCVYRLSWKLFNVWVAKSRRQSISKADIAEWQLRALQEAVDLVEDRGEQEEA